MANVNGGGRNDSHDDGWSARPHTPTMTACPSSTSVTPLGLLLPPPVDKTSNYDAKDITLDS